LEQLEMSSYTEQEEVEKLKSWWKNYGSSLIAGIAVGVILLVGQKYWTHYREQQLATAAQLYQELVQYAQQNNLVEVRKRGEQLREQYRRTPYAGLGELLIGRYEMDSGNLAGARVALERAVSLADDDATAQAARLNLARVLAAEGKTSEALALLDHGDVAGYESANAELRGDLLLRAGKRAEALAAYDAALKSLPAASPYRAILAMKRDAASSSGAQP